MRFFDSALQDVRFGARVLVKNPGFSVVAVLILALGIGINCAIFSFVNALLLRPLPIPRPAELVGIFSRDTEPPGDYQTFSYPNYRDLAERTTTFERVTAYMPMMVGIEEEGVTRRAISFSVSDTYFETFGDALSAGRPFTVDEGVPGANIPVAVVGHDFWDRRGSDPDLVGSTLRINGQVYTIVGIARERFTGTSAMVGPELWLPLGTYATTINDLFSDQVGRDLTDRENGALMLAGRLRPGTSIESANAELATIAAQLEEAFPGVNEHQTYAAAPVSKVSISTAPQTDDELAKLVAAALGHGGDRPAGRLSQPGEHAPRPGERAPPGDRHPTIARWRSWTDRPSAPDRGPAAVACRQCHRSAGGAVGHQPPLRVGDARVAVCGHVAGARGRRPGAGGDTRVLGDGHALLRARTGLEAGASRSGRRSESAGGRHRLVVACVRRPQRARRGSAGTVARPADRGRVVPEGRADCRRPRPRLQSRPRPARRDRPESDRLRRGAGPPSLRRAARADPGGSGVEAAAAASLVPYSGTSEGRRLEPVGRPNSESDRLTPRFNIVTPGYFDTIGLPVLRGRDFTEAGDAKRGVATRRDRQRAAGPPPLARRLWPDGDPIGQYVAFYNRTTEERGEPKQVVGLVPGVRQQVFDPEPVPHVYVPFGDPYRSMMTIHMRTRAGGGLTADRALVPTVRETIRAYDPNLPIFALTTLTDYRDGSVELWAIRAGSGLFSTFGLASLAMAVIGIYGVKAYVIARRTREIGIRRALGATSGDILWLLFREGLTLTAVGLVIGLALSVPIGQALQSLLAEVSATDPVVFAVAPLVLAAAAAAASYLPARRAASVAPMTALRHE